MEKKQLKVSESEYAKNLGVAASTGAAIGGAAFAAAAYSTRAWETDSNEDNETLEIVEESSTDEMIQPETVIYRNIRSRHCRHSLHHRPSFSG